MTKLALVREGPWDRMEAEKDIQFHAFTHYRDLPSPERSIRAAVGVHKVECAQGTRGAISRWEEWSGKFEWPERALAWDQHLDAARRRGQLKGAEDMGRRHAESAAALLESLTAPARKLVEVLASVDNPLEQLAQAAGSDPKAFFALLDVARSGAQSAPSVAKMEREAWGLRGEDEENVTTVRVVVKLDEDFRL